MREDDALMSVIIRLRNILCECADDLEAELDGRYAGVKDHPAMKRRYDRDMETVKRARTALAETDPT